DVYSLGLMLYELLTLRPAFDASIPCDLEAVILKATARAPEERYASAAALAEDLRQVLAAKPVRARRAGGPHRARRWCPRLHVVGLSALLVLLLSSTGVSLHEGHR